MRQDSVAAVLLSTFVCACAPTPQIEMKEDAGCLRPPPDVFTQAGVDVTFAQSTWGKVVTGELKVKTDPKVVSLASNAATSDRISGYLRCLAIKRDGFTPEQAAYLERMLQFSKASPTAEQFQKFQDTNPFPGKK